MIIVAIFGLWSALTLLIIGFIAGYEYGKKSRSTEHKGGSSMTKYKQAFETVKRENLDVWNGMSKFERFEIEHISGRIAYYFGCICGKIEGLRIVLFGGK